MLRLQLLECRIFYFLKIIVNDKTSDNQLMKYLEYVNEIKISYFNSANFCRVIYNVSLSYAHCHTKNKSISID